MTKFLLIRHATTQSVGKSLSGRQSGIHLNDEGRLQAQELAVRLATLPVSAVYTSPLERTLETAAPLCKMLDIEQVISEDFMEIDFGAWTNRSFKELEDERKFQHFNSFRSSTRIPGGELMIEAQVRIIKGIEKLCIQHPNATVAVISHSDMIKAAILFYAGIPLDMFHRIEISPASVSVLEVYAETARILLLNHTGDINL